MAKILVVEDDRDILQLVRQRLEGAGHDVEVSMDPFEALDLARSSPPELAVLDVGLPDMEGLELLPALRELPGLQDLPAIFLSARVERDEVEAGERLGAIYLTKPFVASALLAAVERITSTGTSW